jgi:hypothetical protein
MNREQELLTILNEECAEVIQEASKIIRFGNNDEEGEHSLKVEVSQLLWMIEMVKEQFSWDERELEIYMYEKRRKLEKYSSLYDNKE